MYFFYIYFQNVNCLRCADRNLYHQKRVDMKANEKIVVKKIEWLNGESEMTLLCENRSGNLSYNSRISLPADLLNKVVSDLQKQAPERDINDCLKIEQWSEQDVCFIYDFTNLSSTEFMYQREILQLDFRQIRA